MTLSGVPIACRTATWDWMSDGYCGCGWSSAVGLTPWKSAGAALGKAVVPPGPLTVGPFTGTVDVGSGVAVVAPLVKSDCAEGNPRPVVEIPVMPSLTVRCAPRPKACGAH